MACLVSLAAPGCGWAGGAQLSEMAVLLSLELLSSRSYTLVSQFCHCASGLLLWKAGDMPFSYVTHAA